MTPLSALLREEIARQGPISFERFMDAALYHPEHGYYRKPRDPFGIHGDFVTASQIQPLFGNIIASEAAALGGPVFELGCGRREMQPFFPQYTGIDIGDLLPNDLSGFVFANEFFDALPVRAAVMRDGAAHERLVTCVVDNFDWCDGPPIANPQPSPHREEGASFEIAERSLAWIDRIAQRMESGHLLIIDYGFTTAETLRFPNGTLMSYRRHQASPDILASPGDQDITAHVAFDPLIARARLRGFELLRFETLAAMILRVVKSDPSSTDSFAARQQLKSLLYGMGENFRSVLFRKKKGPDCSRPSETD